LVNIAYVVVVVRARLSGMDSAIEDAARDLGANAWTTFTKVTLPLIWPGLLAAFLLAFAMSVDDYVITSFIAGSTVTFPLFVYGAAKVGLPPQVLCFGTLIFLVASSSRWPTARSTATNSRAPPPRTHSRPRLSP